MKNRFWGEGKQEENIYAENSTCNYGGRNRKSFWKGNQTAKGVEAIIPSDSAHAKFKRINVSKETMYLIPFAYADKPQLHKFFALLCKLLCDILLCFFICEFY